MKIVSIILCLICGPVLAQGIQQDSGSVFGEHSYTNCPPGSCVVTGRSTTTPISSRHFTFEPLPDITPYELALALRAIMPFLADRSIFRDYSNLIDALPPGVKRHFVEHQAR